MKLMSSPTSPFVRKVRILIREKGATARIEEIVVSALADPAELHAANPLGKVPTLVLDDGTTFFNSPLICQFLDEELGGRKYLPPFGEPYFRDMRLQTIGTIAVYCALGYLDFRHNDMDWRNGRMNLAAFFSKNSDRPAFIETEPA